MLTNAANPTVENLSSRDNAYLPEITPRDAAGGATLQSHAIDLMMSQSLKTARLGTADYLFHDLDEAEANILNSKTMPLETPSDVSQHTNLAKNDSPANNLAVIVQDGKEYLDCNHQDPFTTADNKTGII